jgi:hypothetical protein
MHHASWVCYLVPHAGTDRKTAFELLCGKKLDLSRLGVYGSPVYARVPLETLCKHDASMLHTQQGRYLGEGPADSWFVPEGVHSSVQHKPEHVVELDAPLHAGLRDQHAVDAAAQHEGPWPTPEHVPSTPPSAAGRQCNSLHSSSRSLQSKRCRLRLSRRACVGAQLGQCDEGARRPR